MKESPGASRKHVILPFDSFVCCTMSACLILFSCLALYASLHTANVYVAHRCLNCTVLVIFRTSLAVLSPPACHLIIFLFLFNSVRMLCPVCSTGFLIIMIVTWGKKGGVGWSGGWSGVGWDGVQWGVGWDGVWSGMECGVGCSGVWGGMGWGAVGCGVGWDGVQWGVGWGGCTPVLSQWCLLVGLRWGAWAPHRQWGKPPWSCHPRGVGRGGRR